MLQGSGRAVVAPARNGTRGAGVSPAAVLPGSAGVAAGNPYGDLISQRRSSTSRWYHFDALGSTDRLTGADGSATDTYIYKAFGPLAASTGSTTNPFRYVGKLGYYDQGSGPVYLRARYYQAGLGRFVTRRLDASGPSVDAEPGTPTYGPMPCRKAVALDPSAIYPTIDDLMNQLRADYCQRFLDLANQALDTLPYPYGDNLAKMYHEMWYKCMFGPVPIPIGGGWGGGGGGSGSSPPALPVTPPIAGPSGPPRGPLVPVLDDRGMYIIWRPSGSGCTVTHEPRCVCNPPPLAQWEDTTAGKIEKCYQEYDKCRKEAIAQFLTALGLEGVYALSYETVLRIAAWAAKKCAGEALKVLAEALVGPLAAIGVLVDVYALEVELGALLEAFASCEAALTSCLHRADPCKYPLLRPRDSGDYCAPIGFPGVPGPFPDPRGPTTGAGPGWGSPQCPPGGGSEPSDPLRHPTPPGWTLKGAGGA